MSTSKLHTNSSETRKMSALVLCYKCKKMVPAKNTALCSVCNKRFEPDCDGYPEQTYRLKSQESKNKWRCKSCIIKTIAKNTDVSNITMRSKTIHPDRQSSPERCTEKKRKSPLTYDSHILTDYETSYEADTSPNKLSKSLDGTIINNSITEVQDTIHQLTEKLKSTENELENVILDNNNLQEQVKKLTAEIKILKSLCSSSAILHNSPIDTTKKKKRSLLFQKVSSTPTSPVPTSSVDSSSNITYLGLQQKITALQEDLKDAEQEIATLTKQIQALSATKHGNCAASICTTQTKAIKQQPHEYGKRIAIFGAQQCVGLAAALIQSRINTQYEKYGVYAQTMPNAGSDVIMKSCMNFNLQPDDKVVICLGENDHNMKHVLFQLKSMLKLFYKNTIILLNVQKSYYLDVVKLNHRLKNVCHYYKNCHFTNCQYSNLSDICKSINYELDCEYYNATFLNPAEIKKRLVSSRTSFLTKNKEPKKGTIPFYFKSSANKELEIKDTCAPAGTNKHIRRGTIPYYFLPLKTSNNFFRS